MWCLMEAVSEQTGITVSCIQHIIQGYLKKNTIRVITRKMVPITGRVRLFILVFKNKIERRGRQNKNNRPINLPNVITFSTHHPILTFIIHNKYIIYIHTYIHTCIFCSSQLLVMIIIKMIQFIL